MTAIAEPFADAATHRGRSKSVPTQLRSAFRIEELAGHKLAVQARIAGALVVIVLLFFVVPQGEDVGGRQRLLFYMGSAVVLSLLALASYGVNRSRFNRPWRPYLFTALDFMVLSGAIIGGSLIWQDEWPAQLNLRNNPFVYLFIFVALLALSYAPRLVIWSGVIASATWIAGVLMIAALPESISYPPVADPTREDLLALQVSPYFVNINVLIQEVVVMMLVAAILATAVGRSRRLAIRQVGLARERTNLARYFSPRLVDELAGRDQPLGPVRRQDAGVLFVDMVKFTDHGGNARAGGRHGAAAGVPWTHGGRGVSP